MFTQIQSSLSEFDIEFNIVSFFCQTVFDYIDGSGGKKKVTPHGGRTLVRSWVDLRRGCD